MFRHKERDDEIKPSTGVMKWVNKFFRFVLYPFIHPKAFGILVLLLVVLGLGVPYFIYGVKFADMPRWYKSMISEYYTKGQDKLMPVKDKAISQYNKMLRGDVYKAATVDSKKSKDIEEYNVKPQGQRVMFAQSAENGAAEDKPMLQEAEKTITIEKNDNKENEPMVVSEPKSKPQVYFKRSDKLNLTYLDEPEKISGRYTVINANEALVGKQEVFLYGVYTQPRTDEANAAGSYLMDKFDGKQADCYIGAWTEQNVATAICFVDGVSINHALVDEGWAQNISLY